MNNSNNGSSFFKPMLRGLPIIIFTMVAGIIVAKKYLKYTTPLYESTAKIKLADTHEGVSDSKLYKDFDLFATSNKISAEVELLKSTVLVKKAVDKLPIGISYYRIGGIRKSELYTETPFLVKAVVTDPKRYEDIFKIRIYKDSLIDLQSATGEYVKTSFNHVVSTKGVTLVFFKNEQLINKKVGLKVNDNYQFVIHSEEGLINSVIADLDVMSVDKDVPVLRISYKCPVPQKAADMVNALSAAYITDYIDEKCKSADTTVNFLDKQLKTYSSNLSGSENDIENYRTQHNIINIQQETETDLRKVADLKKQLASVQMSLKALDSLNRYISLNKERFFETAPNFEEFTDLLSTELVKKIGDLQRDRKDLLLRFTPEHESVKSIDAKLNDIANYLQESIRNSQKALQIKYNDLQKSISESEQVFVGLPTREKNMGILDRNFGLNQQIYNFLHEKRTEAEIAKAATISFHRIISQGEVPEKQVSPNVTIITILAGILGLFAGIFMVYGVHGMKGRVNDQDTISRLSGTIIAAAIPFFKTNLEKARFFKGWVLQMELKNGFKPGTIITISSFDKMEGKTVITDALAQQVMLLDKKVLLLNASEKVTGELEKPVNWKKYIESVRHNYDLVLIKNLSLDENPAGLMVMAASDQNLLVLDSRRTKKTRVTDADFVKDELKLTDMQFVLNRAGYTPSLFAQAKQLLFKLINKKANEAQY